MVPQVLILGTGIAGLSCAINFAEKNPGARVTLLAKERAEEGSTRYAQGGIASVWSHQDSFQEHEQDTLMAGAGLCHPKVVQLCVQEGPERIRELIQRGVRFTKKGYDPTEEFDLHREGGHSQRRILHADDLTGQEIQRALLEEIKKYPLIKVFENHVAIDLITAGKTFKRWRKPGRCLGAYALDQTTGKIKTFPADITILATGGSGKVYLYTSNPDVATGDGIAMAHRAGARVANLEFMQFHPTCLFHPSAKTFLISEALRGEGAILRNLAAEPFMNKYHPRGDLAPRDIVARAIDSEMKRTGDKHVWLDATQVIDVEKKFPNISETCRSLGIEIQKDLIPVVPAAHYMCGGVLVDEHGESTIEALYAVGEAACTGLHGANRLASNSLLEATVFASRVAQRASEKIKDILKRRRPLAAIPSQIPEWDPGQAVPLEEQIDIAANWFELRTLMWNYVGIVRSNRRLERAKRRLELLKDEVNTYYWRYLLTRDLIELRNLLTVSELIIKCALTRKESRGLNFNADYPQPNDAEFKRDTVI